MRPAPETADTFWEFLPPRHVLLVAGGRDLLLFRRARGCARLRGVRVKIMSTGSERAVEVRNGGGERTILTGDDGMHRKPKPWAQQFVRDPGLPLNRIVHLNAQAVGAP
jgi:hypothetical protein